MAQILRLLPPSTRHHHNSTRRSSAVPTTSTHCWSSLSNSLNCNGRFSCLFSDNRKQEQARKALDGALGGKKIEFEKWNEEIKKREETGGGGNSGGGGWFRRFGGSDGEHFWQEAQQASLAILGLLVVYLIVAKGDVMLAVFFNPLLFALRGTRSAFAFLTSKITNRNGQNLVTPQKEVAVSVSAKDRVMGKWRGT